MSDNTSAVFGIYPTHAALEAAVDALRAKGFRSSDISILATQRPGFTDLGADHVGMRETGGGTGAAAAVGGTLGWVVGMSALAFAGGAFIVAGPVMAALAKMGEAVGGIATTLAGFGVPEAAAKQYEGRIVSGGMMLSVHTDDSAWFSEGRHILEQTGAEEITATGAPAGQPPAVSAVAVGS
jgi:hypothetical protein